MQNTAFSTNKTLNLLGRIMNLEAPKVMGILNVTPDSFYDGGRFMSDTAIATQAEKMIAEGADIIDIGGYSSRPGASDITLEDEIKRVVPATRLIRHKFPDVIISIDTFRSEVARAAVQEGASIVNDISGGELDPKMFETIATLRVPFILMHMRGTPATMKNFTHYDNLIKDLLDYFRTKIIRLSELGVNDIIIDPGFGFAKTREQNFTLLNALDNLSVLNRPILAGVSRKSMIWKTLNIKPEDALIGTTALHAVALLKGASLLRVHDVKEAVQTIRLMGELKKHQ